MRLFAEGAEVFCVLKLFQENRLKGTNFGAWVTILF